MDKNKIITYSLLAHINNSGLFINNLFDVFIPLAKRTLSKLNEQGLYKGKSILEIKNKVDELYKLDIPIPILKIILEKIAKEVNSDGATRFFLYGDLSFEIKNFTFLEYEEILQAKEKEIKKLEALYKEFQKIHGANVEDESSIFNFIDSNKISLSKYLNNQNAGSHSDFTQEALFVNYFKDFPEVYNLIREVYLGSIISSYLEYKTEPIKHDVILIFDTNFLVSLLDLNTPESTLTCRKLIEITKKLGYKLNVLDITLEETSRLFKIKAENFEKTFLQKKVDPEDIFNACERRGLSKTDLERIADNLEDNLFELGIRTIPYTEKYRNIAKHSREYEDLKKIRNTEFAALHDATALHYVRENRGKSIRDFSKINCWFVNNSSSMHAFTFKNFERLPETIKAEDFLNILWLSNPDVKSYFNQNELSDIGLTRLISCTLNESLPKSSVIKDLDENIQKYAKEKISDGDVLRIATSIANRSIKNIEGLNTLANTDRAEFIKRLQLEAGKQRQFEEESKKAIQSLIDKIEKKEKRLDEIKKNYDKKINNETILEVEKIKNSHESEMDLIKNELAAEKKQRIKLTNEKVKHSREKFIWRKIFWWRLRTVIWLLIIPFIVILFILFKCYTFQWDWGKTKTCFDGYDNNTLFVFLKYIAAIIYTGIFIKVFSDKFGESNKSKYIERIDMPENLKDIKE